MSKTSLTIANGLAQQKPHGEANEIMGKREKSGAGKDPATQFLDAARNGRIATLERLLNSGMVSVNESRSGKRPAAFQAALHGQAAALNFLIDQGANLGVRIRFKPEGRWGGKIEANFTPLQIAAYFGHADCVKVILERRLADVSGHPSTKLKWGSIHLALHYAVANGWVQVLNTAAEAGISLNHPDGFEAARSAGAVEPLMVTAVRINRPEVTECLAFMLEQGGSPHLMTTPGSPLLHLAAQSGNADALRLLLKAGVNANVMDLDRRSALHVLDSKGKNIEGAEGCVRLLIAAGSDPNQIGSKLFGAETPLERAQALAFDLGTVDPLTRALVEGGAKVTPKAILTAAQYQRTANLEFLLDHASEAYRNPAQYPPKERAAIEVLLLKKSQAEALIGVDEGTGLFL